MKFKTMNDPSKKETTTIVRQVLKKRGGLRNPLPGRQLHKGGHPETGRLY